MKQESLKFSGRASNPTKQKFSPAQLAAQKLFAERARSGTLKKGKRKANPGLYDNINAKRARIKAGSGERMRKPGSKGAPTQEAFERYPFSSSGWNCRCASSGGWSGGMG